MDKLSRTYECFTSRRSTNYSQLLFADDSVLLAFSEPGLQYVLNSFSATRDITRMKISIFKIEVLHLSKNLVECFHKLTVYIIEVGGEVQVTWGPIKE